MGAWGTTAVNQNMQVIDGILGGVLSLSLASSNVSLSIATGSLGTGSLTPGGGPVQSANAVVKFSGTLTGNCVITFPCPGFWIVENNCTVGSFYVQARASGTGNVIGLPLGEPIHIYNDGTDCKFVNMGRVGSFLDLVVATTPLWIGACTIKPYFLCDATIYSTSVATTLAAMLGSTFGGNGVNTFAVPDLWGRYRIPIDATGTRITAAGSGISGTTLGATGGSQNQTIATSNLPASIPYTDNGHVHGYTAQGNNIYVATGATNALAAAGTSTTANATTNITINPGSPNTALRTVPPGLVFGLTFIKT